MSDPSQVFVASCKQYEEELILSSLPSEIFAHVQPGNFVVLKPNWVMESHKSRPNDWEYVITHPSVITAVLIKVLGCLGGKGRVSIVDGPMTEASFAKLIQHYPVSVWQKLAAVAGVVFEIIDLRDHEWLMKNDVVVERKPLPGDPRGKVLVDIVDESSEFWEHKKSQRGYYGADYDRDETNLAHDGHHNLYSVSRTVIEADIFINIPKLKTHRKAGITCCLKNLVGINTYKNYLPHHTEGGPSEGGDQFSKDNLNTRIEGSLVGAMKQYVFKNSLMAHILYPLNTIGKKIFGDSSKVVRNGSWYGNDTLWRMILDLNKVLLYANNDGTLRPDNLINAKCYIGVVDAVVAGEGEGPLSPDPVLMGRIVCGTNPVAIDATCATLMGFDPVKIPTIFKSFEVRHFPLCGFSFDKVKIFLDRKEYHLCDLPSEEIVRFTPQFGWKMHIEK